MSSDESTSTQISVISSQGGGNAPKLKPHKPEQWEINLIGNFLLTLYHRLVITPQNEWMCKKSDVRKEFGQFITPELSKRLKDANGTDNIGTLLHRCDFLFNTPRGNPFYKLKNRVIFDFRNRKLSEQDKRRINDDADSTATAGPEDILRNLTERQQCSALQASFEIDEDSPVHPLQYEGTTMQQRRQNYYPTNMSCFICQKDFAAMDGYEEHIQTHNDENEFEYLKELNRFDSPIFSVSYRLCKNSHHFCFTIESQTRNLVIEKIIIVQSRSMFYVHNMRVPYAMPENGSDHFYVDSHLFAIFVEQPIVLICHLKDSRDTRIIEEHHFMRALEFPKVNFAIKPYQLPSKKTFKPTFKLPDYFPPLEIRDALKDDFIYEKLMQTSNEFRDYVRNQKILQPQTIGPTLTTLLHIEDMDTIKDYLSLLQHNVKLRSFGDDYSMRLRPKQRIHIENVLSVFDDVIITTQKDIQANSESLIKLILQNSQDMMPGTFIGHIQDVNSGRVSFKCYRKLDLQRTYTIIFRPSRLQLRYQYRAMELLQEIMQFLNKFLFPAQLSTKPPSTLSLELYNKSIYNNPEQLQAVRNIAEGPRNDATYIIFGPPGTGKTTTLVESILQVLKRDGTKILVTASSNSACDEVALRLCKILDTIDMSRAIVRIYAQSNEARIDTIDDMLLEHSNMYSVHFYPDVEVLHEYRIVVCTMAVVAKLSTGKFGRRENGGMMYSHLFIDEVAASTEVETLMAITSVLTPKSCLIIAGDHKQLGPIVKSKRAEEFNLAVSLMDRLLARECYRVNTDTGDYDRSIQSRLRMNFRSHPAIVNLYSGMYYNHDLEAKAKIDDVSLVKNWHMAPSKDFPIIFHSIQGKSYSDNQSFSLYNSEEINTVMDYVKDLMYFGINGKPVRESDIGIISPYKKQYLRIREELNLRKWYQIETGSVETFQGKEKNIIIVSFVRSGTTTLGFLENPRRLNVTLSRAKALLIMIGNARTLSMNPDYDYIVKECQRHQTLIGRLDNQGSSAAAANNYERTERRGNNYNTRYNKQTPDKESTLDMVNKTLKDLKLKNNNENSTRVKQNHKRRARAGEKNISEKNKENSNNNNDSENDNDDDDGDDNDEDDDDNDNKPSTSKAAGKSNLSQPMKKKNQPQTRSAKSNKGDKHNASNKGDKHNASNKPKDQPKSKTNLESFFDELPNVPKTAITTTPSTANVQTKPLAPVPPPYQNQVPPLMMMQMQRPPTPVYSNNTPQSPYFMGSQLVVPNGMGLPRRQLQQQHHTQQQPQMQQHHRTQQQMQQQHHIQQQQQWQQHNMQQLQQQWHQQQLQQLQQNPQQLNHLIQKQRNHLENVLAANAISESKRAQRRRNGKAAQAVNTKEKKEDNDADVDDEEANDNKASTSKAAGKPHLAHPMKKKNLNQNQNQNVGKVSKAALKTATQNTNNKANVTINGTAAATAPPKAAPLAAARSSMTSADATQPLAKASATRNVPESANNTAIAAVQNLSVSANKSSGQKTSKVIASISGGDGMSSTITVETTRSTASSAAVVTKYSPNSLRALRPTSNASNDYPFSSQTTGIPNAICPSLSQPTASSSQTTANRTTASSSPLTSSATQNSSSSLNRPKAATAVVFPTLSQTTDNRTTASSPLSSSLNRPAAATIVYTTTNQTTSANRTTTSSLLTPSTTYYPSSPLSRSTVATNVYQTSSANRTTTSSTLTPSATHYSSSSMYRPTADTNVYQTSSANRTTTSSPSATQYSSSSLNRPGAATIVYPTTNQTSSANRTTSSSSPSTSLYSSSSLNRTTAAENIYPTLNQRSNSSSGQTTTGTAYSRSSTQMYAEEALHYNQPHRPVRQFHLPEENKKKDNCVIA